MAGFCIPKTLLYGTQFVWVHDIYSIDVCIKNLHFSLMLPNRLVKASDCCLFTPDNPFGHSQDESLLCFTPIGATNTQLPEGTSGERIFAKGGQCVPSSDILTTSTPIRCSIAEPNCGAESVCYQSFTPYRSVVRIQYSLPSWLETPDGSQTGNKKASGPQVVVYQGDPKDIWEAVEVTTMGSRWSFLPLGLPNAILLTIQYTMSFSLALSVLNIVPARHLDGHHALKAFSALIQSIRQSYRSTQSLQESLVECLWDNGLAMASASTSVSTSTFPKGLRAVKGIVIGTTVLLGGVIVGSLVQMIFKFVWV